jgi:endonuclease/exonuclease/phosphatase family metal-dependent hydrolase
MTHTCFCLAAILNVIGGMNGVGLGQPATAPTTNGATLRLMTYNIQAARHSTHTNKTRRPSLSVVQDLEKIATVIEKEKPDVLFLQEVMRFDRYVDNIDEFEWLRQRLGYPVGLFASGTPDPVPPGTSEWGVAVYLRTGRIISSEKHLLGSNRVLFRVTASLHGAKVTFYCTHLGSGKIPQQARDVGAILKDHASAGEPIVLAGDFQRETCVGGTAAHQRPTPQCFHRRQGTTD